MYPSIKKKPINRQKAFTIRSPVSFSIPVFINHSQRCIFHTINMCDYQLNCPSWLHLQSVEKWNTLHHNINSVSWAKWSQPSTRAYKKWSKLAIFFNLQEHECFHVRPHNSWGYGGGQQRETIWCQQMEWWREGGEEWRGLKSGRHDQMLFFCS